MNLYYATDTFVEPNGFQCAPQQVIAPNEEEARKVLPHGEHRQLKLVRTDIEKPLIFGNATGDTGNE